MPFSGEYIARLQQKWKRNDQNDQSTYMILIAEFLHYKLQSFTMFFLCLQNIEQII